MKKKQVKLSKLSFKKNLIVTFKAYSKIVGGGSAGLNCDLKTVAGASCVNCWTAMDTCSK